MSRKLQTVFTRSAASLLTVALAVAGILAIIAAAAEHGWTSEQVAAWVQAVGTIGAIAFSAWTVGAPLRHAEAQRRRERDEFLKSLKDAADYAAWIPRLMVEALADENLEMVKTLARDLDVAQAHALNALTEERAANWPTQGLFLAAAKLSRIAVSYLSDAPRLALNVHVPDNVHWLKTLTSKFQTADELFLRAFEHASRH